MRSVYPAPGGRLVHEHTHAHTLAQTYTQWHQHLRDLVAAEQFPVCQDQNAIIIHNVDVFLRLQSRIYII